MSQQQEDTDKSFEATPHKLAEARKKGELAKSTDLFAASAYAGLLLAIITAGPFILTQTGTPLMILLDQPGKLAQVLFEGGAAGLMLPFTLDLMFGLLPLALFPAVCVCGAIAAQRALVFAPSKLKPKLSRISLISNAKNKFGRGGLFEFLKSFSKLLIYSVILALFIWQRMPQMIAAVQGDPANILILLANICLVFLLVVVVISSLIGGVDAVWQHMEHLRKNRMSHRELKEETKNQEGDPHLKQERRQRAMSIAQNQMMADVPDADVIVVNPEHFAVALKWNRKPGSAPVCVAKGVDAIADAIRKSAQEAGVPIHRDPPTARALYATTDVGQEIGPDLYRAVAAAIRFAETMRQRARGRA